jgi:hypothetical protein
MPAYQLNINFSQTDLASIRAAGKRVIITKQTYASSGPKVAWLAFLPQANNTVSWQDQYTMYASRSELQNGTTIQMMSQAPAQETKYLPFNSSGLFGAAAAATLPLNCYGVQNGYHSRSTLVFGLAQKATVNGAVFLDSPTNAGIVFQNQSESFSPLDALSILVHADVQNGMVISSMTSPELRVTFDAGSSEHTITYDATIGGFRLSS